MQTAPEEKLLISRQIMGAVQSVVAAVHMEDRLLTTVVQMNVERAGHRHDELLQSLVSVRPTLGAARHVVEVVNPLDVEGDMALSFDEGQVAARILNSWQIDDPAVTQRHTVPFPALIDRPDAVRGCLLLQFTRE